MICDFCENRKGDNLDVLFDELKCMLIRMYVFIYIYMFVLISP